ncbi:hypothetical protein GCM10010371_17070 [Streptomyces subrutilus]|uniref:Enoyl reductase (ER) domain-containing protein n=1 Tax=Streptomyces subrutilus TaxID=36818 RepID=A0A918QPT5_9ACTN|nr:hypothetical protein GCM10010371_17070 [Streptomyces subrutilus]
MRAPAKIAVVGAYGAGKTSLIHAAGAATGLPSAHGTPMRDPAGGAAKPLEEATEPELVQLVVRRLTERVLAEAALPGAFLSDGSLLHEWVYATVRLAVGLHPGPDVPYEAVRAGAGPYREVLDHLGREVLHRALSGYDAFVHLPVEFPLGDPVPPISEHFRALSDRLLLDTLERAGATVHTVTGPPPQRLAALTALIEARPRAVRPRPLPSPPPPPTPEDHRMHAIGISQYGAPEVLALVERPRPSAAPGEVLVRVLAAAVNPTDLMLRSGELGPYVAAFAPPHTPGMDASGEVVEVGPGVTDLAPGDRVMAFVNPFTAAGGAQAEYVAVPAGHAVRLPDELPTREAAGLPMNGLTAHQALALLDLAPGATLAVTGGAGALGGYAVELARHRGLRVLADAADADRALLERLGADVVVPRGATPEATAAAYRAAAPDGVDGLVDAAVLGAPALDAVRDGGALVKCRPYELPETRGIRVHQAFVVDHPDKRAALAELAALAAGGAVTLRTAALLPAAEAARAHALLERGGVRGRLILTF